MTNNTYTILLQDFELITCPRNSNVSGSFLKSVQMTKSCLAPKSHLRLGKQGLHLCNSMLHQCNQPFAPMSAKIFRALSKAFWARSVDLTCVPDGRACNLMLCGSLVKRWIQTAATPRPKACYIDFLSIFPRKNRCTKVRCLSLSPMLSWQMF